MKRGHQARRCLICGDFVGYTKSHSYRCKNCKDKKRFYWKGKEVTQSEFIKMFNKEIMSTTMWGN